MHWQAKFLSIMELCIPKVVLPQRKKLPWITKQVLQTIKKKKGLLEDYVELQQDIDLLFHWAQNNSMALNTSKCKYMIVSRKHNPSLPPTLCLGNTPLERVHMYKYLGVILTSNLSWSEHINSVCMKARKLIGLLYRRFYAHTNQLTLFNPYLKKETEQLEKVQRFTLRMCMKQWDASYSDLFGMQQ